MRPEEIENLRLELQKTENISGRLAILDRHPSVIGLLSKPSPLKSFLQKLNPDGACAIKQLAAIGQLLDPMIDSEEKWNQLLQALLPIDAFYRQIGGIVGYQAEVNRLLKSEARERPVQYHAPIFDDISTETPFVRDAIEWGLEALPQMAEIYPLGGAADRLHLIDETTKMELPAAKLRFCGRSLLESLVRDLAAREWLYEQKYGHRLLTPIAIMTSHEKNNHSHVVGLCEEQNWFGRPKDLFRFFVQPLVPTVDEKGQWLMSEPLKLLLKPGGHGAIWKLARDEGIFDWLRSLGRKKALVRQINNPAAGLDYGLLAFTGIGWKRNMAFGFASCPRLLQSAEGMNVLVEKEKEVVLTNIEYTDFTKFGIEDRPLRENEPYSRFSSNTNILFVDLDAVEKAVDRSPFPGLLINLKPVVRIDETGQRKEVVMGRLESTMQNLADVFAEPKIEGSLQTKRTFVTYNERRKTISVAKKAYVSGKPLLETTEQCFYELSCEHRALLSRCGFALPEIESVEEHLRSGPSSLFLYHNALGPLYSIIEKKLRGGSLTRGSELILDLAKIDLEQLDLDGSLRIMAPSFQSGSVSLKQVRVVNRGVDWSRSAPFWKMDLKRSGSMAIELRGNGEFIAEKTTFAGPFHFVVRDGVRMIVSEKNGALQVFEEPISKGT